MLWCVFTVKELLRRICPQLCCGFASFVFAGYCLKPGMGKLFEEALGDSLLLETGSSACD